MGGCRKLVNFTVRMPNVPGIVQPHVFYSDDQGQMYWKRRTGVHVSARASTTGGVISIIPTSVGDAAGRDARGLIGPP